MTTAQSFLFFLIVLGGAATVLRLVSRTTPTVPYPVLLAAGGILIGLIPGVRLPAIGSDLILLAFVPGLVFEASLAVDLTAEVAQDLAAALYLQSARERVVSCQHRSLRLTTNRGLAAPIGRGYLQRFHTPFCHDSPPIPFRMPQPHSQHSGCRF